MFETLSMIGLGYIGLPTATLFASRRKKVIGVDVNAYAVDTINQGRIHIVEPELDMLVQAAVHGGYLRATLTPEPADAFLIAVPTPFLEGNKPDLSYIADAAKAIAPVLAKGNLVILESTSPVGTTEQLAQWLAEARPDLSFPQQAGEEADIQVAYCPERVLPGRVVHELVSNDRVIGGMTQKATEMAIELYRIFVEGALVPTNARTAEMCKLTENSFRDVNIAFANELSLICDRLNINVWELISLANRHPRVNILQPGAGVGGHCIAVDPWFIVDKTPEEARIVRLAREINDYKPEWVVEKVKAAIAGVLSLRPDARMADIKVACLGLAFKPDIDDLRESPAVGVSKKIASLGCKVQAVEPNISELPAKLQGTGIELAALGSAMADADVVCVLVKHRPFIEQVAEIRKHAQCIDVVGLFAE
ncbi:UDP-N-acetyl-D-mannosamine dehydrogenase [Alcaligenes faecalis]|uniref:UDP-N-acetyl-D-mannosamine dehydrogenase n=1 Tax=Alcaligenes faecalis TaxID=511 RepID=UPI0005A737D4|nr:UDP-N-acetyl-D-mannosamine dehydrogenase [Alcaligenes faecalis]ATI01101.1 UDP-N-acetyl-D-mannosamine dehydrogenase [Alcaligenes faecalis]AYZ90459.1 UDP-N-acetyl-D-mannosamine dehydrogenase [Alcaligenes faecalis]MCX5595076.1 UDP-N-acetyl-D-mannosamine dehydrogenase [Alcaligenes faecalis]QQC33721.1 UDP-N-acetyl-D-mannosamine dehydrogenase [Alcaligenes faecalis]CAJ0910242.1 UDP-N-acetyl-D-mannosamine dehydrogenase [Alcaligenes faecalis subsp. faecalis]